MSTIRSQSILKKEKETKEEIFYRYISKGRWRYGDRWTDVVVVVVRHRKMYGCVNDRKPNIFFFFFFSARGGD